MDIKELALAIKEKEEARAEWVKKYAPDLAPLGHRSATLKLIEARIILAGVEGKNEREREADLLTRSVDFLEHIQAYEAQVAANLILAVKDADIDYHKRLFKVLLAEMNHASRGE